MFQVIIRTHILLLAVVFISSSVHASGHYKHRKLQPTLVELWTVDEMLSRPESVVYDAERDILYVSNIDGSPSEKDGVGYISTISPEGDIIEKEWISGLNAPKGMAIYGSSLFVSDIDTLIEINLDSGAIVNLYEAEGAIFLNDVAIDSWGQVYVSDSSQNRIYRLRQGSLTVWVDDERISRPNGIFVRHGKLIVAAGDSSADRPDRARYLQSIKLRNKRIRPIVDETPIGSLDGVEKSNGGGYFISDFRSGDLYHFTRAQGAVLLATPEKGSADIDFVASQNILYVPILNTGKLIAYKVLWCR